jgi:hypothetical protein
MGTLRLPHATVIAATLASTGPHIARAQDHSPDFPHLVDTMKALCLGRWHKIDITAQPITLVARWWGGKCH